MVVLVAVDFSETTMVYASMPMLDILGVAAQLKHKLRKLLHKFLNK